MFNGPPKNKCKKGKTSVADNEHPTKRVNTARPAAEKEHSFTFILLGDTQDVHQRQHTKKKAEEQYVSSFIIAPPFTNNFFGGRLPLLGALQHIQQAELPFNATHDHINATVQSLFSTVFSDAGKFMAHRSEAEVCDGESRSKMDTGSKLDWCHLITKRNGAGQTILTPSPSPAFSVYQFLLYVQTPCYILHHF